MWLPLLLLACSAGPDADQLPPPVQQAMSQALPADLKAGRLAFRAHCSGCHGLHGRGDGPAREALGPPDLASTGRDVDGIASVIRSGLPGTPMKAFGGQLEAEEIQAIAAWIASLEPGSAPPPLPSPDASPSE
jgi:mono/diheme cytochrome c family protein